jgi:hypothetical protein
MKKQKIDQLENFFIRETMHLIAVYEELKNRDPRDESPVFAEEGTIENEIESVKAAWMVLIAYAKKYNYTRFKNIDPNLEEFFLTKINNEEK